MNKPYHYNTLAIEVTRRCNMNCAHCMRGDAQNKDITPEVLRRALENVIAIESIVFTGGEATLNVDAIAETLRICKDRNIAVGTFYIATNGKDVTDRFVKVCIDWYSYILECNGEPELCGVALSSDKYHEAIPRQNLYRLQALSFFTAEDKKTDWNKYPLINLGRAKTLVGVTTQEPHRNLPSIIEKYIEECDTEYTFEDTVMTVTADGDILCDCDYEYSETDKLKLGTVYDGNWVAALLNKPRVKTA